MSVNPLNQFGPIFVISSIEDAVAQTMGEWFPTYLAEAVRQNPLPNAATVLAVPKSVTTHRTDARWPEEALPQIIVQMPGTYSLEKRGDGSIDVWWALSIICVVQAASLDDTQRLSAYYAAAARTIMLQKRALMGLAGSIEWIDEQHNRILTTEDKQRSLQVSNIVGRVLIPQVANDRTSPGGPDQPDPPTDVDPTQPWPLVATAVTVDADAEALT